MRVKHEQHAVGIGDRAARKARARASRDQRHPEAGQRARDLPDLVLANPEAATAIGVARCWI